MYQKDIKEKALALRLKGKTYSEIRHIFGIPKGTLSSWFKELDLAQEAKLILVDAMRRNLVKARISLLENKQIKRQGYLQSFIDKNAYLGLLLANKDIAKIALAMLYLGEGAKSMKSRAFVFGNSDHEVISLFLRLLRQCYTIDESKFRCTLQCRADQDTGQLQEFWYTVTGIPLHQFYKPRVDPRTIGQTSDKPDYKGVCRIDYFSAEIFLDIMQTIKVLVTGP